MQYEGDVSPLEEIAEQDLDGVAHGGVTPLGLSKWLGNDGRFCTITHECQLICF